MPKLYRSLLAETYGVFLATLLILLSIILSFRLANLLSSASRGDIALGAILQLLGLQGLRFLILLAPVAFVLAAMMTLGRWQRDLETTALLASGLGYGSQLRALLLAALPLGAVLLYLQLGLLPGVYASQEALQKKAQQEAGLMFVQPRSFRSFGSDGVIYIDGLHQNQLEDFFLQQGDEVLLAARGRLEINDEERLFYLDNGRRLSLDPERQSYGQFQRAELSIPLSQKPQSNRLRTIATADLDDSPAQRAELQLRLNGALALLFFVPYLPLLARSRVRGGKYQKVLPTFIAFAGYYNLLEFLVSQMKKGKLPLLASPALHLLVLVGAGLYWQLGTRKPAHA